MSSLCCCCFKSDNSKKSSPRNGCAPTSINDTSGYYYNSENSHEDTSCAPPLLAHHGNAPYTNNAYVPSSPRSHHLQQQQRERNRQGSSSSANEYVSHVVNLCRIGAGSFAVVSLVIDKRVLAGLKDSDSSLAAFFAVKRISKRHEASRLAPGEGGAHAERHTHAILEHPFFPVLYNACRSNRDFYIAFPFALGADLSKALARRANSVRGFGKDQAAALHAEATANGTMQGMKEFIGEGSGTDSYGYNNNNNNNLMKLGGGGGGVGNSNNQNINNHNTMSPRDDGDCPHHSSSIDDNNNNNSPSKNSEIRATELGLPIGFVCLVAFELLSAITFLNEKGFTHYDIRPGNLLLIHGGHVILGDFGMIRDESGNKNADSMNITSPNSTTSTDDQQQRGPFSKFFSALLTGSSSNNNNNSFAASGSGIYSQNPNGNASFNNNGSFSNNVGGASPRRGGGGGGNDHHHETSNEKRSQLYLSPEHLSTATNVEAQNDCKRLSDVWSYGVLLLELALGAHPFTPQNGQDASAYAMLASIKRMQFRKIPTNSIQSEAVVGVVDLLNDLCATIFVARDSRPSALSLMQHPFFASPQVRTLLGMKEGSPEFDLPAAQFFGKVVNAKKLVGPASFDPLRVCLKGGCPSAKELREWLPVLAPIPQTTAPEDYAPTLDVDEALYEDDSRELIDLRFFGSLSDEDLRAWSVEDNENCLRSYDSDWCPEDMGCARVGRGSHAASSLASEFHHHNHNSRNGNNNNNNNKNNGGGGGGRRNQYHDGEYGPRDSGFAMQDQPGFTFVRPSTHMM